jgi:hypothetical protein
MALSGNFLNLDLDRPPGVDSAKQDFDPMESAFAIPRAIKI